MSSLTFHIFNFSFETTEWNSTKLDRKQDFNVLYQVCVFQADRKNKMPTPASDWLRHFRWMEFNETWQEARSQHPLRSLCFFWQIGKARWMPWPIHKKSGTLYSGARYVAILASLFIAYLERESIMSKGMTWLWTKVISKTLKAHNLPISVSITNTRNFCIVTTCKVMPMYEITIAKSFAN